VGWKCPSVWNMDGGCGAVCDYICGRDFVVMIPRVRIVVSVEFRSHAELYNRCLDT
jgi:hypothetical protein